MTARPEMSPKSILEATNTECKPSLSQHVLNDCNLATTPPPVRTTDRVNNNGSSAVEEDRFMHDAPKLARENLGLPADATSQVLVDTFITFTVDAFKHLSPDAQKTNMNFIGIDEQTKKDVIDHKPGGTKELGAAVMEKEKAYFDIPNGKPMTPGDYQKLENGILLDSYRQQRDVQRIHKMMLEDQK